MRPGPGRPPYADGAAMGTSRGRRCGRGQTMAERSRDIPLVLLDVAIGTAASGLGGLARGRDVVSRVAAPVTGPAARAVRTLAGRLPAVLDGPLQVRGQAQRAVFRAAVESR